MSNSKIKVLYITSLGHSGSTLLERMLGQINGLVAVGELRQIWEWSFGNDYLCGCGARFSECQFWQEVAEKARERLNGIDPALVGPLRKSVEAARHIPKLISPCQSPEYKWRLEKYTGMLLGLYKAIRDVSGSNVIVDASKAASHGFVLRRMAGIDPYMIHLVRDSRGVAFSHGRRRLRPEVPGAEVYSETYGPAASALGWVYRCLMGHCAQITSPQHIFVRYEDLVRDPRDTLLSVIDFVGEAPGSLDFLADRRVRLEVNHTVAGNPMRFHHGWIDLREDLKWREKMKLREKIVVTLMTFPLLTNYGYRLVSE